jgi:hypothetical protein
VALPASVGFRVLLKYCREPAELIKLGRCAGFDEPSGGEQRSQRRRSISWHDLASNDGAEVASLRQFPLSLIRDIRIQRILTANSPNVTVCKVPPPYWFGMVDRQYVPYYLVLEE